MLVYRIGITKFAKDLTGEGARLNGGRWNHKLVPCIYTSETRALALLEYTVNTNIDEIPRALSITTFKISGTGLKNYSEAGLPGNWKDATAPGSTKDFGTRLLRTNRYTIIKIPSVVVPNEYNYILNPAHPDFKHVVIEDISDFVYDVRIKLI